jgi:hypothetical protein
MNRSLNQLRLVSPASQALQGGAAPACWHRDLVKTTARRKALQRMCAWIPSMVSVHTKLSHVPLLGHCLAALTESAERVAEAKPNTTRPRQHRFVGPDNRAEHVSPDAVPKPHATAKSVARTSSSCPLPEALKLAKQADAKLLRCLAGENKIREHEIAKPSRRSHHVVETPPAPKTKRDFNFSPPQDFGTLSPADFGKLSLVEPKTDNQLAACRNVATQQSWLNATAQRAEHLLQPRVLKTSGTDQPHVTNSEVVSCVVKQWATPLNGQMISRERLGQLSVDVDEQARKTNHASSPPNNPRPREWPEKIGVQETSSQQQEAPAMNAPATTNPRVGERERRALSLEPPNAPPLAPSKPLHVPPSSMTPTPLHLPAPPEAGANDEDLNALATKIKRILDEEARRHGIDV